MLGSIPHFFRYVQKPSTLQNGWPGSIGTTLFGAPKRSFEPATFRHRPWEVLCTWRFWINIGRDGGLPWGDSKGNACFIANEKDQHMAYTRSSFLHNEPAWLLQLEKHANSKKHMYPMNTKYTKIQQITHKLVLVCLGMSRSVHCQTKFASNSRQGGGQKSSDAFFWADEMVETSGNIDANFGHLLSMSIWYWPAWNGWILGPWDPASVTKPDQDSLHRKEIRDTMGIYHVLLYIYIYTIYIYTRQSLLPSNGSHLDPKCQTVTYNINHA